MDNNMRRNIKDTVFTHLFQDKQYVLQLFQTLHPEAKDVTEDMIRTVTLEKILVGGIYNDLGFMVGAQLIVLIEAQSTWSINILIRIFLYIAKTYQDLIAEKEYNLYGSKKIPLPKPELYVIYTGIEPITKDVISLSEEYFGDAGADLDLKVHVLTDSKQGDIINQYVSFTRVVDEQVKDKGRTEEAILEIIRICKENDILAKYLTEHEQEVEDIMVKLFDQDLIWEAYTNEKVEEGKKQKALEVAGNMLRKAMSPDLISELSGLPLSEVSALKARMSI